jgi:hypothetical protein
MIGHQSRNDISLNHLIVFSHWLLSINGSPKEAKEAKKAKSLLKASQAPLPPIKISSMGPSVRFSLTPKPIRNCLVTIGITRFSNAEALFIAVRCTKLLIQNLAL